MATFLETEQNTVNAVVLAGLFPLPLPRLAPEAALHVIFPDFDFGVDVPIVDFRPDVEHGRILVSAALADDVVATLDLTGGIVEGGTQFRTDESGVRIVYDRERARANFIASTLKALFSLSKEIHLEIPRIEPFLGLKFDQSLLETSRMLQRRQAAYRLMVIERATGEEFLLPPVFSAEEIERIAFVYYAIVDRSFFWSQEIQAVPIPATTQDMTYLISLEQMTDKPVGPVNISKTLFDKSIPLGQGTATFIDGRIERFDDVRNELARADGHLVNVVIRSVTGQVRYELPDAPRLPDSPWETNIQALIDLEHKLDSRLVDGYNALAAASLAGLTEEEVALITARPELDETAFLIDD